MVVLLVPFHILYIYHHKKLSFYFRIKDKLNQTILQVLCVLLWKLLLVS